MTNKISEIPALTDMIPPPEPFNPEKGWRYRRETLPDGREVSYMVPLTSEDFLNPQEGDVMPQTPLHEWISFLLTYMLRVRYLNTHITIFHDFIINWGIPGLSNPSPDISVVPNVRDVEAVKRQGVFFVKQEGTKPILVIEIVSPHYRKEDRKTKVEIYEQVGVPEYVIFDFYTRRGRDREQGEVIMYRLVGDRYIRQTPDEDGLYYCQTVDLRIGLEDSERLVLEDGETGQRLRTPEENIERLKAAIAQAEAEAQARAEAEAQAEAEAKARAEAEARIAQLEAELRRLRGEG